MHVGLEDSGLNWDTFGSEKLAKAPVKLVGNFWRCRIGEGRSSAFSAVAVKGEIGHHQNAASNFQNRPIEFALFVLKDPQVGNFACEVSGVFLSIALTNPQKHQKPTPNLSDFLTFNLNPSLRDPLNDCPHLRTSYFRQANFVAVEETSQHRRVKLWRGDATKETG
jgi:hypothetical protein